MYDPERQRTRPFPDRLLLLSLTALVVPVAGTLLLPEALAEQAALLWLVALVPVFLLAYVHGMRGALAALAAGGALLLATALVVRALERPMPGMLWTAAVGYLGVGLAIGWTVEILHRKRDQVEDLAFTDLLTGLPNRRHAGMFLSNEFAAAERGRLVSVVLFDLDRFKEYNDEHGHQAGDEALRVFATVISRQTRRMNLSSRFGGEEFLSVLAGSDLVGAFVFAERVRTQLRARNLGSPPLTVSAGVAEYTASLRSPEELLAAADQALYDAKRAGRNRVHVFGHPDFRIPEEGAAELPAAAPRPALQTAPASHEEPAPPPRFGIGHRVLLVEDDAQVRRLIATSLGRDGFVVVECDSVEAGLQHLDEEFDVVISDVLLGDATGDQLVKQVRSHWPATQVVVITGLRDAQVATAALNAGADRYLFKPFGVPELRSHVADALERRRAVLAQHPREAAAVARPAAGPSAESIKGARALVRTVEMRERYTQGHSARVAELAEVLADELDPERALLGRASLRLACELHDIGKIAVSESVLNKEGGLTPQEVREMRQHAATGRRILEPFLDDPVVLETARWHHEWWNGAGYPDGKAGEDIPLAARIVALAEGLAALTSPRTYRGALSLEDALIEVRERSGTQYDPTLVGLLEACEERLVVGRAGPTEPTVAASARPSGTPPPA